MKKHIFLSHSNGKHTLLLILFLILTIVTYLSSFILYSSVVIVPVWALWLLYIAFSKTSLTKDEKTFVSVSFFFLAIILIYRLTGYSSTGALGLVVNVNWIMLGVVAVYAMKLLSEYELSIVYIVMVLSLFIMLQLIFNTGRFVLSLGDAYEAVSVADAWQGALLMLISGLSLIVILNVNRLFPRIVAILALLLTLYINIFILQRGTNVIFTLVELSLILVFLIKRKSIIILLSILLIAFVIIAMSSDNLINLFEWFAQVSPSERLSKRFDEIALALTYESIEAGGGSFAARGNLIGVSWDTFTSSFGHFIFGAGDKADDSGIIGRHSFIVDTLARYGIIGGVLLFVYFKKQFQIVMTYLDRNNDWALFMQCAVLFLFYYLRNFYGQFSYALVNLVILVFFPLTFQLIRYYKK